MWKDILAGFIRHGLTILGAWMVTRGFVDEALSERLVGESSTIAAWVVNGLILMGPFFLSLANKVRARIMLKLALAGEEDEATVTRISREIPLKDALRGRYDRTNRSTPSRRFPG